MKTSLSLLTAGILSAFSANASDLVISGVIDGPLTGGIPKAVELYVVNDIADLSVYGIGTANNGGGTDGVEFTFPADSASAGSYIYVASEIDGFTTFFGSAPDYDSSAMGINGDDAIELFQNDAVVDTFGAIDVDGSGETWEYTDGWAYRKDGETANSGTFDAANWTFSGTDALDGEGTNTAATTAFPAGTFSTEGGGEVVVEPEVPTVELGECSTDATLISAIQGSDDASAEVGNSHIVEAVITGFRADGFFIQEETVQSDDDATTSEGLFVDGSTDIEAGHIIRLYGEVGENYGLTTLTMDADVTPADCGASDDVLTTELAMPYDVDLETLEGMLVSVTDATVTSQNNLWRYGELVVSDSIKRQPSDVAAPLSEAYEAAVEAAEASLLTIEDDNSNSYPDDISYFPTFSSILQIFNDLCR